MNKALIESLANVFEPENKDEFIAAISDGSETVKNFSDLKVKKKLFFAENEHLEILKNQFTNGKAEGKKHGEELSTKLTVKEILKSVGINDETIKNPADAAKKIVEVLKGGTDAQIEKLVGELKAKDTEFETFKTEIQTKAVREKANGVKKEIISEIPFDNSEPEKLAKNKNKALILFENFVDVQFNDEGEARFFDKSGKRLEDKNGLPLKKESVIQLFIETFDIEIKKVDKPVPNSLIINKDGQKITANLKGKTMNEAIEIAEKNGIAKGSLEFYTFLQAGGYESKS